MVPILPKVEFQLKFSNTSLAKTQDKKQMFIRLENIRLYTVFVSVYP